MKSLTLVAAIIVLLILLVIPTILDQQTEDHLENVPGGQLDPALCAADLHPAVSRRPHLGDDEETWEAGLVMHPPQTEDQQQAGRPDSFVLVEPTLIEPQTTADIRGASEPDGPPTEPSAKGPTLDFPTHQPELSFDGPESSSAPKETFESQPERHEQTVESQPVGYGNGGFGDAFTFTQESGSASTSESSEELENRHSPLSATSASASNPTTNNDAQDGDGDRSPYDRPHVRPQLNLISPEDAQEIRPRGKSGWAKIYTGKSEGATNADQARLAINPYVTLSEEKRPPRPVALPNFNQLPTAATVDDIEPVHAGPPDNLRSKPVVQQSPTFQETRPAEAKTSVRATEQAGGAEQSPETRQEPTVEAEQVVVPQPSEESELTPDPEPSVEPTSIVESEQVVEPEPVVQPAVESIVLPNELPPASQQELQPANVRPVENDEPLVQRDDAPASVAVPLEYSQTDTPHAPFSDLVAPAAQTPTNIAVPSAASTQPQQPGVSPTPWNAGLPIGGSVCDAYGVERCEPDSALSWGGWVSGGFHSESNGLFNNRPDQLNLHQAWLYAESSASCERPLGFRVDLMYGIDAADTQAFGNNAGKFDFQNGLDFGPYGWAIPQAYLEVALGEWNLQAGHFFTLLGYEVVAAPDNFFYSHAITMVNSEPFTHTGVLMNRDFGDLSVYAGWTLGWDTGFDQFGDGNSWLGGVRYQINPRASIAYFSTAGNLGRRGDDAYSQSIVVDWNATDKLNYVLQSDYLRVDSTGEDNFGINQYWLYAVNERLALGTRLEWWKGDVLTGYVPHRGMLPMAGSLSYYEVTLGANIRPTDQLAIRPEIRHDWSPAANYSETYFGIDAIWTF